MAVDRHFALLHSSRNLDLFSRTRRQQGEAISWTEIATSPVLSKAQAPLLAKFRFVFANL